VKKGGREEEKKSRKILPGDVFIIFSWLTKQKREGGRVLESNIRRKSGRVWIGEREKKKEKSKGRTGQA